MKPKLRWVFLWQRSSSHGFFTEPTSKVNRLWLPRFSLLSYSRLSSYKYLYIDNFCARVLYLHCYFSNEKSILSSRKNTSTEVFFLTWATVGNSLLPKHLNRKAIYKSFSFRATDSALKQCRRSSVQFPTIRSQITKRPLASKDIFLSFGRPSGIEPESKVPQTSMLTVTPRSPYCLSICNRETSLLYQSDGW